MLYHVLVLFDEHTH